MSQKHAEAVRVKYYSGFFITTNSLPDFGVQVDNDAIYHRLRVFETTPLPKKNASVMRKSLFYSLRNYH